MYTKRGVLSWRMKTSFLTRKTAPRHLFSVFIMKNKISLLLVMLLAVIVSCDYAFAQNIGFVQANGSQLELNGQTFYFSSSNQYYLFYKSQNMIDEIFFDAKGLGINVLRTWGACEGVWKDGYSFQPSPGLYDENTFRKMDYIIYKANQNDVRLIIPLVDNWSNFGGMDKYVEWSPTASSHDEFYTDTYCKQRYKDYVNYFLNRTNSITGVVYKNDPTILIWELANEPRCQSDPTGSKLQAWIDEMAAYVKSIDPIHLVSTGEEGWYKIDGATDWKYNGSQGTDFIRNHQSLYIDVCTFHLYPNDNGMTENDALTWIQEHTSDAHNVAGKPIYAGEFGWKADRSSRSYGTAALYDFFEDKEGFSVDWGYRSIKRVSNPSYDGNGSLRFTANLTSSQWSAGGKKDYSAPQNYSAYDYLSAWIYVPAGAPNDLYAELYVKSTNSLKWADGDDVTLIPGQWVQVKIASARIAAWGGTASDIRQIGIQVKRRNTNYSGYVYYDLFEGNTAQTGNPQMDTRNRIYAEWYNGFDVQNTDGAGFWILSGYQDDGTLYPDYDWYTIYYPEDTGTSAVVQNFSSKMQSKSGLSLAAQASLWDGCEMIGSWVAAVGYSDAIALNLSNSFVNQGSFSFKIDFSSPGRYKAFIENNGANNGGLNEDWSVKSAISFDLYNPGGSTNVDIAISTGNNWDWYESSAQSINSGWNTVTFNLKSNTWKSQFTNWQNTGTIFNLNQIKRLAIGVFGYNTAGSFYVDNVQLY